MEQKKLSPTVENYLGVLYILERDDEPIVGIQLAELFGVSSPTVTNTLKRMLRDDLLYEDEKGLHLSEKGLEAGRSVMRRHMLSEWVLSRMLSWSQVHDEAHELEHAISEKVEAALLEELSQPTLCPHGNPLPGFEQKASHWVPLTKIAIGEQVIIRRIHELAEEVPGLLSFLEENELLPGKKVSVQSVLPFNQTITLSIGLHEVVLGYATAKYIFVEPAASHEVD